MIIKITCLFLFALLTSCVNCNQALAPRQKQKISTIKVISLIPQESIKVQTNFYIGPKWIYPMVVGPVMARKGPVMAGGSFVMAGLVAGHLENYIYEKRFLFSKNQEDFFRTVSANFDFGGRMEAEYLEPISKLLK